MAKGQPKVKMSKQTKQSLKPASKAEKKAAKQAAEDMNREAKVRNPDNRR